MSDQPDSMVVAVAEAHEVGDSETAAHLVADIRAELGEGVVDLCLVFASAHYDDELDEIVSQVHERLGPRSLVGCTGEAVVAGPWEHEGRPTIALWAARMPGVRISTFHVAQDDLERLNEPQAWYEHLAVSRDDHPNFILLADPFSVNTLDVLDQLEQAYPGRPAIGGIASAAERPGQNRMVFGGHPLHYGLCGVALSGNIKVDTIVSQGCRPIGKHMVITDGEENVIRRLGGRPALSVVIETLQTCSPRDIELVQTGDLLIGRVIDEHRRTFRRGDFLIRNPLGFERDTGAMMINDLVRPGQTIQFHVRDSESAHTDFVLLLKSQRRDGYAGALVFTCNGRGRRLFNYPNHDSGGVFLTCGGCSQAGLFCAGEIGPLGNRNFLHGQTASVAFFRSREEPGET